jgi:hypothetical protein
MQPAAFPSPAPDIGLLIWGRGGIEISAQVDEPGDLEGCTMSINVLDVVKGRTARLFHYTDLFFNKERDCDPDDDDHEGIEVTCE